MSNSRSAVMSALCFLSLSLLTLPGCKLFSPEHRACSHLAEVCEEAADRKDRVESCEKELHELRGSAGSEAVDRTITCIQEAKSCIAAAGCMVGGIGGGILNEFIKGVQKSLPK
ncbi:MAG TPA: hypothetical protein PKI03_27285 [Pseudomonadota bacterium]|nr:hypothetical protein [Pseudomonadota bacterium]